MWANTQGGVLVYHAGDTVKLVGWGEIGDWMQTPLVSRTFSPAIWGLYEKLFGQYSGFLAAGLDAHESIVHATEPQYATRSLLDFRDPLLAAGLYVDLQYGDMYGMACSIWHARRNGDDIVSWIGEELRQAYATDTPISDVPRLPDAKRAAWIAAAVERHPYMK